MKIAIYGGSFNPPHTGHVEAAFAASECLRPDKMLIIPASIPPHKELADGSPDANERLELTRLAFADVPNAEVSDMEILREGKSYSADTLEQLMSLYPGAEFTFVMGSDMLFSFEEWYRFRFLLENMTLGVFCRNEGEDARVIEHADYLKRQYGAKCVFINHEPRPMSSSDIRDMLPDRRGASYLPETVYSRIIKNGDYDEAVMLANRWGEDPENAAEAGILHDITKKLVLSDQLILCRKYGIINDTVEEENVKLLHAKTGAALARDLFNISDEVYDSIRWHTTGKPDMTLLEKIIYMADYIEPNRDFDGVDELRRLAYENLDEAMTLGLKMSLEDIKSYGQEPYYATVDAYKWYTEHTAQQ